MLCSVHAKSVPLFTKTLKDFTLNWKGTLNRRSNTKPPSLTLLFWGGKRRNRPHPHWTESHPRHAEYIMFSSYVPQLWSMVMTGNGSLKKVHKLTWRLYVLKSSNSKLVLCSEQLLLSSVFKMKINDSCNEIFQHISLEYSGFKL